MLLIDSNNFNKIDCLVSNVSALEIKGLERTDRTSNVNKFARS